MQLFLLCVEVSLAYPLFSPPLSTFNRCCLYKEKLCNVAKSALQTRTSPSSRLCRHPRVLNQSRISTIPYVHFSPILDYPLLNLSLLFVCVCVCVCTCGFCSEEGKSNPLVDGRLPANRELQTFAKASKRSSPTPLFCPLFCLCLDFLFPSFFFSFLILSGLEYEGQA